MAIKLIIGLQNPGSAYEHTRHNAGAWLIEALASQHQLSFKVEKKLQVQLSELSINGQSYKLALPLCFMNQSGLATRAVGQFYRVEPQEMLIIHDELDLAPGRLKLKTGGGHGGHNGLRDIISQLNSSDFHRLRLGIGHPGHKDRVADYVLSKPSLADKKLITEAIAKAISVLPTALQGNMATAMNRLNS